MSAHREAAVQAAVIAYLTTRGDCFVWRNNTGALKDQRGQVVKFGLKGSADIIGMLAPSGRFIAVECKRTNGGVVSTEQRIFGARVTAAGGIYVIATSVEDVRAALPAPAVQLPSASGRVYPR